MSALRNLSILVKLAVPALILALIAGGVVFVARTNLSSLEENTREIVEVQARRALFAQRIEVAVDEAIIEEKNITIETDETVMAQHFALFKASKERALAVIGDLIAMADSEKRRTDNEAIKSSLLDLFGAAERSIAHGLRNENEAAAKISRAEVRPAQAKVVDLLTKRVETNTQELKAAKLMAAETADTARLTLTLGAAVGLIFAFGLLAAIVILGITRPLANLVAVLQRMAHGEIDSEIREAVRGDEIGAVGRAVEGIKAMV